MLQVGEVNFHNEVRTSIVSMSHTIYIANIPSPRPTEGFFVQLNICYLCLWGVMEGWDESLALLMLMGYKSFYVKRSQFLGRMMQVWMRRL